MSENEKGHPGDLGCGPIFGGLLFLILIFVMLAAFIDRCIGPPRVFADHEATCVKADGTVTVTMEFMGDDPPDPDPMRTAEGKAGVPNEDYGFTVTEVKETSPGLYSVALTVYNDETLHLFDNVPACAP